MFFFNLCIDFTQVSNKLLFLIVFPKHVWHFFLQRTDDVGMDLDQENAILKKNYTSKDYYLVMHDKLHK